MYHEKNKNQHSQQHSPADPWNPAKVSDLASLRKERLEAHSRDPTKLQKTEETEPTSHKAHSAKSDREFDGDSSTSQDADAGEDKDGGDVDSWLEKNDLKSLKDVLMEEGEFKTIAELKAAFGDMTAKEIREELKLEGIKGLKSASRLLSALKGVVSH
eukprot:g15253.t1